MTPSEADGVRILVVRHAQQERDGTDGPLRPWRPEDRVWTGCAVRGRLREFQARVEGALRALLRDPPTGRLVLVVHSGVLVAVLRWAFGLWPDTAWTTEVSAPHASITELEHWPKGRHPTGAPRHTVLARLGDVSQLPPDLISGR